LLLDSSRRQRGNAEPSGGAALDETPSTQRRLLLFHGLLLLVIFVLVPDVLIYWRNGLRAVSSEHGCNVLIFRAAQLCRSVTLRRPSGRLSWRRLFHKGSPRCSGKSQCALSWGGRPRAVKPAGRAKIPDSGSANVSSSARFHIMNALRLALRTLKRGTMEIR